MARKPKLDTVLAEAVDTARLALAEVAEDSEIGEYRGVTIEDDRLVTHRFVSLRNGYRGWTWFVTLARVPRAKAKDATVCELGIIPGEDALLAPAWVPWADRLAQEEIEADRDDNGHAAEDTEAPDDHGQEAPGEPADEHSPLQGSSDEAPSTAEINGEEDSTEAEAVRRPVRRRRTAQRTAARRRAAARGRSRRSNG